MLAAGVIWAIIATEYAIQLRRRGEGDSRGVKHFLIESRVFCCPALRDDYVNSMSAGRFFDALDPGFVRRGSATAVSSGSGRHQFFVAIHRQPDTALVIVRRPGRRPRHRGSSVSVRQYRRAANRGAFSPFEYSHS